MLTATALSKFRDYIKKNIAYGKYKLGATFYQVPIQNIEIVDGKVYVYLLIDHSVGGTLEQFQLYDVGGDLFADKPDNITKDDTQGVLVRFSFLIQEV